ncbi:MAG: ATP-dependent RecD-like DNA helicase [Saprospiraceae bacterium]
MDEIFGYIERITFQNADNGWTVARMQEKGKRELTTIVGTLTSIQVGETVRCKGVWKNDLTYGYQFSVEEYRVEQPSTIHGIKKYLGSGMIKGIGNKFAERIVDYHGLDTLDVIDTKPEALLEVDGIGKKRLEKISSCWAEQKSIREVMVFLQGFGISPTYAQKVFKTYGDDSIEIIQKNPYQLAQDIWGIGFKTADVTAQRMGISRESDMRIDSGVEYVLNQLANDGHTCYPVDQFLEAAQKLLEVDSKLVSDRLEAIQKAERIIIEPLIIEEQMTACVWLTMFRTCENGIAKEIIRLQRFQPITRKIDPAKAIEWAEKKQNIQLAAQQKSAVINSIDHKFHIITGGPGTGKSTITKVILAILTQLTPKVMLAAPTGRAAKRLSEITGMQAATIHALLKFDFNINGFQYNRDNPLDCDLLIVDEASMIDTVLMYNLLKAIPDEAKVILVGDVDQLPSVGAGNVLQDMINAQTLPVTKLTEIFRQAANSKIIISAHRINAGLLPNLKTQKDTDFFWMKEEDTEKMALTIANLVKNRLPKAYRFHAFDDIQVLSPMNRGVIGTRNLNTILQKELNPSNEPLIKMGRSFHVGDKVMQIQNDYDKNVFNGDVGRIKKIDRIDQEVIVTFDNREVYYDFSDLDQLVLAYAVSVHKYQGSECPCIIMPVHTSHYMMLYKNLIYTGLTRGKKLVIMIGMERALQMAVRNNKVSKRFTGLREVLKGDKQGKIRGNKNNQSGF